MAYIVLDDLLGFVDLYIADTAGPGPEQFAGANAGAYGRANFPGMELRGYDVNLGAGTFVFARAVASITQGQTVELTQFVTASNRYDVSAQPWAGTANTAKVLAVALGVAVAPTGPGAPVTYTALLSGQWGWFQLQGLAVAAISGAPVAGNPAFWQASGTISPTTVASKAMLSSQFASAPGVTIGSGSTAVTLSASQALVLLSRPTAQGPIT